MAAFFLGQMRALPQYGGGGGRRGRHHHVQGPVVRCVERVQNWKLWTGYALKRE